MTDWQKARVFGLPPKGISATIRPSAYAVIENDRGQFAVVRTPEGIYLPGGGMDPDETPVDTAIRETLEECGLAIRVGLWTSVAVQFAWSETAHTYYEKRCTFVDATVLGPDPSRLEADHELLWVAGDRACEMLTHESHGWAVGRWEHGPELTG